MQGQPLNPKEDKHLIPPNSITPESNSKGHENKENDQKLRKLLIVGANSPCECCSECVGVSMEKMHTDVRV